MGRNIFPHLPSPLKVAVNEELLKSIYQYSQKESVKKNID